MGFISRSADLFYTFRFLRLLTTPWTNTGAYKAGLIDDKGNKIRSPETDKERDVYNLFHRLVFNLKKLINKIPFGKTTLASYLAALYLIKEKTGMSDEGIGYIMEKITGFNPTKEVLAESRWFLTENNELQEGKYCLMNTIALRQTGDVLAHSGSVVESISGKEKPVGTIFGKPVFEVHHIKTGTNIYITQSDISKINL